MSRAPMTDEQAGQKANQVLRDGARYLNRRRITNDDQAFQEIKRKVNTTDLAQDILDGFEVVDSIDAHRKR